MCVNAALQQRDLQSSSPEEKQPSLSSRPLDHYQDGLQNSLLASGYFRFFFPDFILNFDPLICPQGDIYHLPQSILTEAAPSVKSSLSSLFAPSGFGTR